MSRHDRRAYRESPYLDDHARSQRQQAAEPRGFSGLLRWFLEGFWAETPEEMHAGGAWFGRPARTTADGQSAEDLASYDYLSGETLSTATELTGGSQLGAPRQAEPFRQLLENSPRQTQGDGPDEHYVRPMRAALARLASRADGDAAFMARYLLQVAYAQGDWSSVAERWFALHEDGHADRPCVCWVPRRSFTEQALRRLHAAYRPQPPVRYLPASTAARPAPADDGPGWLSISESQRAAAEADEIKGAA
jgi:hypothetical protein